MPLDAVTLDDKYDRLEGRVYLTGTQALVRLLLEQRRRDARAGLNTAGYVTGYRGSPLGVLDRELWRAGDRLTENAIHFQPGVNEDLAATAVWGTQTTGFFPGARHDGVFALWYGKGPGVDRTGDVFRHANQAGTAPLGGVLALLGDDPASRSSTVPSQSEPAMIDVEIPVLHPASVAELIEFGLAGWAMSRFSGCWVAMKAITDTMDSSAPVMMDPARPAFRVPDDFVPPPDGLHIRPPEWPPLKQEWRLKQAKLPAVRAFARANGLDRATLDGGHARRFGIVTTGKSYLDVLQALDLLGIDDARAATLGLCVYKVGLVWPLEPDGLRRFAAGLDEILVVEEKRAVIESQVKEQLYNWPADERPRVMGECDEAGAWILPSAGELEPGIIARAIAGRLARLEGVEGIAVPAPPPPPPAAAVRRLPYFCSGCPHNTSTRVPAGSRAVAGIGCHYMVTWMDRDTVTATHMGGEGANWLGMAPFTEIPHMFVNMGDGTYFHSGLLAIRAAVASGVNVTYKILYNGAVAMTGGQPVDGPLDVAMISRQVAAEGVARVVVVTDDPAKYRGGAGLAAGTAVHHRDDLDRVQTDLRKIVGVTVLIYDQACAAELRRHRKRGEVPDPPRRAFINDLVCEGCGDCGEQSNCVSVVPLETPFGRKRAIDQSSCNKDFSCIKGFCPSFVTVHGGELRRAVVGEVPFPVLPDPVLPALDAPYAMVVAGIGGTGVVTTAALLGMAAHLEGKGVTVLDQIGLSQKNGAVVSHVRIAARQDDLHAVRIAAGGAHLVLGCDLVAAAGGDVLATLRPGVSRAVVDAHPAVTAEFTHDADFALPEADLRAAVEGACGAGRMRMVDAAGLATALLGTAAAANLFTLGAAWQVGLVPLTAAAIDRAIELNGVAVEVNRRAFLWGRRAAHDPDAVRRIAGLAEGRDAPASLKDLMDLHVRELSAYQSARYARRYRRLVERVRDAERDRAPGRSGLAETAALALFKVMAVKDEYEVARLYSDGRFEEAVARRFAGAPRLTVHMAPPLFARRDPATGHLQKREYGAWVFRAFRLLAALRRLRGSWLDPFGHTAERRGERALRGDYADTLAGLLHDLTPETHALACEIAALPLAVRGFGHVKKQSREAMDARRGELLTAWRASKVNTATAA